MSLSPDQVKRIALLARIEINAAEIPPLQTQLNAVFDLIETMRAVDTSNIEPMAHAQDISQRLRPDIVTESDRSHDFLALAPESEAGVFLVPRVIE